MSDRAFIDTNILIYAHDRDAGPKHGVAAALVRDIWLANTGALSTQVLQEFYVNVARKMKRPLPPARARELVRNYFAWHIVANSAQAILRASEIEEHHRISFWDALIVAAARASGSAVLYTEDLSHGQLIEGVEIINPFR